MNPKLKKIVAIIALVFMAVFTVSLILYLFDSHLFNGAIGYIVLSTGFSGISLFLVIKLSKSYDPEESVFLKMGKEDEVSENENEASENEDNELKKNENDEKVEKTD